MEFDGIASGGVAAFERDPGTGSLRFLNAVASGGIEPTDITLAPDERMLAVANYRNGSVAVFPLLEDRVLGAHTSVVQHEGNSVHPLRQASPHAHQVVFDPSTGNLLVPDLGLDAIIVYRLGDGGDLREVGRIETDRGVGPRHLVFHPQANHFFLVNELANTVSVFRRSGDSFEALQSASTLLPGDKSDNTAAGVACSGSGRTVLVSNRGDDSIAVYRFDVDSETIVLVDVVSSHGAVPKSIGLIGDALYVANLKSDSVEIFDLDDGGPSLTHHASLQVATPASVLGVALAPGSGKAGTIGGR